MNEPARTWFGRLLKRIAACISFSLCVAMQQVEAQSPTCSQATVNRLETQSDGIRTWSRLRAFYYRYRVCRIDDAEVTEGVSESVARMLADHWETLPDAATLFKRDASFEAFALAGINITDLTDDLNRIDRLAAQSCPANLHPLCRKIRKAIGENK